MMRGYRRFILIEPLPGEICAELEDDYHRMVVVLQHRDGIVTRVTSEMKRAPWTSCPGAMAQLEATFLGQRLADFARRGERPANCTHLHDLALFAAAHAGDAGPLRYEIFVSDPQADGQREARLSRNGAALFNWTLVDRDIIAPAALAGRSLADLGEWIATLDHADAEAARILRWASIVALGRTMQIPAGLSATVFPAGTCYTFQPERAVWSKRLPGADIDFSAPDMVPLADRSEIFS